MTIPVPIDIPLPQPSAVWFLKAALVFTFLLHILFVLLMVGGSLFTLLAEVVGLKRPGYDRMAREIGKTLTVNKSLAVVLGVGPLLVINTLYTVFFYSANALTGKAWILIVPLVTVAFLLSYAHEYFWDALSDRKGFHLALIAGATALFLTIPFIFLANINLMLYPEAWGRVHGFLSSLLLPNVLPRYLHFLTAAVAVTALFLAWYFGRDSYPVEERLQGLTRAGLRRLFFGVAFGATGAQLLFGPLLYLTLPSHALSWSMTGVILAGAAFAVVALVLLWRGYNREDPGLGRPFALIVVLLSVTVLFMATGRHMVRENALRAHRAAVEAATSAYEQAAAKARTYPVVPGGLAGASLPPGKAVFKKVCVACHEGRERLVGPPIEEIQGLYAGNPAGIATWAKAPGRKRKDYPAMAPQPLPKDQLDAVAEYMLSPDALEQ